MNSFFTEKKMIAFCSRFNITKIKTIMNSNSNSITIVKPNHYLNMFQFYKQKYSTKSNINLNFNFDTNSDKKRGTKRKFSEAFL
jgi:hypothetical protein